MSTARRRLKSTQLLSGTSSQSTMVTLKSISWSWMDDSHPFRPMLTGHCISKIRLLQTLTFKFEGHGHGCGQRARAYGRLNILLIRFFFILHQSNQQFLRYSYFEIGALKIQDQCDTLGQSQGHMLYPASNRCTFFSFYINRTNHSWDMSKRVFDL